MYPTTVVARRRKTQTPEALLRVSAMETRRIGQALHDEIGQQLTGLSFLTRALADSLAQSDKRAASQALRILRGLEYGLSSVRRLSRGIVNEPETAADLRRALELLCERVHESSSASCRLRWQLGNCSLTREVSKQFYRIAQESMHNAVRHGSAGRVNITLLTRRDSIELLVEDDGCGFPPGVVLEGMGLEIMRFRAGVIGGEMEFGTRTEGGAYSLCRAPLKAGPS